MRRIAMADNHNDGQMASTEKFRKFKWRPAAILESAISWWKVIMVKTVNI